MGVTGAAGDRCPEWETEERNVVPMKGTHGSCTCHLWRRRKNGEQLVLKGEYLTMAHNMEESDKADRVELTGEWGKSLIKKRGEKLGCNKGGNI